MFARVCVCVCVCAHVCVCVCVRARACVRAYVDLEFKVTGLSVYSSYTFSCIRCVQKS